MDIGIEGISTPEKEKNIPELTTEEWLKLSSRNKDDEGFQNLIEEKGIELNNGIIKIKLDGEIVQIKTDEENLGEIVGEMAQDSEL